MPVLNKTVTMLAALSFLAACGGGGGGSSDGPQNIFSYQDLDSDVPGESTIAIAGLVVGSDGVPTETTTLIGALDRATQDLDIASLVSGATQNDDGSWTNGEVTIAASTNAAFTNGTYDFIIPVTVTDEDFAGSYILGVVSRTQDLPTSGEGIFTGTAAVGGLIDGAGSGAATSFESVGDLTLTARFEDFQVDLLIENLTDDGIPFDTVTLTNLDIDLGEENLTFISSGASTFDLGDNDPTGDNATLDASGAFFGGTTTNGPAEAGGGFLISGDDGTVFGVFAADERTQ